MKIRMRPLIMAILLCSVTLLSTASAAVGYGDKGETVRKIQQKLIQYDYLQGTADGIFGTQTLNAVVRFQKKNGLTADGVVGAQTAAALGLSLSTSSSGSSSQPSRGGSSASDTTLLARVVHGEARGEPYIGMVAVAAVVLNRVRSPSFPNTLAGVVYQPGAFTCVADGQIQYAPGDQSYRAAQDALNGWDPSGGCLYYYNPKTATQQWIYSRTTRIVIGNHRFCM